MGKITQAQRRKEYYKIYEQIYEDPVQSISDISQNTGISRNTVTKYLQEMYTNGVVVGPYIEMKPARTYKEYVHLLNFSDPFFVLDRLKGFPHVIDCGVTFGDWNIQVVTDRCINFSKLKGVQSVVYQGVKRFTYTPKVECTSWDEPFKTMHECIKKFTLKSSEHEHFSYPLHWGPDQWKLYHAFKHNLRQKVTPLLRKIKVRYETYTEWMKTLENHCTVHTEFYPEGLKTYMGYCFLFSPNDRLMVQKLLSLLPTSSVITEVGDQVLVFTKVHSPDTRKLFCTIYDMMTVEMIEGFSQAVILYHDDIKGMEE